MTTTIAINCGCGSRFTGETEDSTSLVGRYAVDVQSAMVAALAHCRETGHTLEILGQVQP